MLTASGNVTLSYAIWHEGRTTYSADNKRNESIAR